METTKSDQRKLAAEHKREHVEHLLRRYPDISIEETAEIVRILKKGLLLEIGLTGSDDEVKSKFERFRADHAKEFSIGVRDLAIVGLIMAALVVVGILQWDAGAGR